MQVVKPKKPKKTNVPPTDPLTIFGSLGYSNALGAIHNGSPGGVKVGQRI